MQLRIMKRSLSLPNTNGEFWYTICMVLDFSYWSNREFVAEVLLEKGWLLGKYCQAVITMWESYPLLGFFLPFTMPIATRF